jgi:hypothetical protein
VEVTLLGASILKESTFGNKTRWTQIRRLLELTVSRQRTLKFAEHFRYINSQH